MSAWGRLWRKLGRPFSFPLSLHAHGPAARDPEASDSERVLEAVRQLTQEVRQLRGETEAMRSRRVGNLYFVERDVLEAWLMGRTTENDLYPWQKD